MEISVEYVGGPYDGRRHRLLLPAGKAPPQTRALETDPVFDSWLDREPVHPPEVHRYDLDGQDGDRWRYRHRGLFPDLA